MKKFDVIVIGDANPDLIFAGFDKLPAMGQEIFAEDISLNLGGGAALCAAGMAKLGLKVRLIAAVGNDFYGDFIISELQKAGVDTTLVVRSKDRGTGLTVALTDDRERAFITYKGTNEEVRFEAITREDIKDARHIHILGYGKDTHNSFKTLINRAKDCGLTVSFDIGWDPSEEWDKSIFEILSLVDIFTPNEIEALSYTKSETVEGALEILSKYVPAVAIKLGSKGSIGKKDGMTANTPPFKVNAVDTTGAGDSFNAGFIYSFLNHFTIDKSLQWSNACGALSTTAFGGNTAFPGLAELKRFVDGD